MWFWDAGCRFPTPHFCGKGCLGCGDCPRKRGGKREKAYFRAVVRQWQKRREGQAQGCEEIWCDCFRLWEGCGNDHTKLKGGVFKLWGEKPARG